MRRNLVNVITAVPGGARMLDQYRQLRNSLQPSAHRGYVGGMWDEIGKVQIDFMVGQGLKPDDVFVDVACGSLRAGCHFISYLDPDNYLGIDHHRWLIKAELKHELPKPVRREKRPEFVISKAFEFGKFTKRPKLGLAQSLFSHLTPDDIHLCLTNLRDAMQTGGHFYATFVPNGVMLGRRENPAESADDLTFEYEAEDIPQSGREIGWRARKLGDWG